MLKRICTLIVICFLVSGCSSSPNGYFQKSANNKLFDRKGFHGGKRSPIYNKKYISKAKQNVAMGDYDDDDDMDDDFDSIYQPESISKLNRDMYRQMVEEDMAARGEIKRRGRSRGRYPSVNHAYDRLDSDPESNAIELRDELDQIKTMLYETQRDLASRKCPTINSIESEHDATTKVKAKSKAKPKAENDNIVKSI